MGWDQTDRIIRRAPDFELVDVLACSGQAFHFSLRPAVASSGAFGLDFPESCGQRGDLYRSRDANPLIYLAL